MLGYLAASALLAACLQPGAHLLPDQLIGLVVEAKGAAHVGEVVDGEGGVGKVLKVALLVHLGSSGQTTRKY